VGRLLYGTYDLVYACWLHQFRREEQLSQERVETLMALSQEHGFPQWSAWGTILRGKALAEQFDYSPHRGITEMHQGLAAHLATGAEGWRSYFLALLAEVHGKMGQAEEGLTVLAEALTVVDKSGERFYEAELYRLKGTLTLQSQSPQLGFEVEEETEGCFHKAIEIAHKQQAKSLELRAVMSLVRLWQHQGKKDEARQMLADIDGWFTEGFDTKDLQEARALLAELG